MTQKELKALYADTLAREVWKGDQKMVDYCVKKIDYIVELTTGRIVALEKPSIEKDFCFGYRSACDAEEYEDAHRMANHAGESTDYFMRANLEQIDRIVDGLNGKHYAIENRIIPAYYRQPEGSILATIRGYYWHEAEGQKYPMLEGEDLRRVLDGYAVVRANFEKRLKSYIKRYGMSKVNTWTYWTEE